MLALGANVFNMALAGVAAGYLPYRLWGRGPRGRSRAIFAAGAFSVMTSACLALGQLLISGVPMAGSLVWASLALFLVNGLMEGAITVAAVHAIERLNPAWVTGPQPESPRRLAALAMAAMVVVVVGTLIASVAPDGIQRLTGQGSAGCWSQRLGGARRDGADLRAVFPGGQADCPPAERLKRASSGYRSLEPRIESAACARSSRQAGCAAGVPGGGIHHALRGSKSLSRRTQPAACSAATSGASSDWADWPAERR